MWLPQLERFERTTPLSRTEAAAWAALPALAVFLALYLAVGLGLYGFDARPALLWPYTLGGLFTRAVLVTLTAFAGVAAYVFRLSLRGLRLVEEKAAVGWRAQVREEDNTRCREELQKAGEAREAAERRLAASQENLRRAEQKAAAAEKSAPGGDEKFQAAKRAFARLYHPDNVRTSGLDKLVRAEIFKEYWGELEAIGRGGRQ